MHRRTLLTSLATLAATAGYVSGGDALTGGSPDSGTPSPTDAHTDTRTTTETPATPSDATDVFADFECPSFDDHADEAVCYHAADAAESDLLLTAQPEVFDPYLGDDDVETLRFALYNRSEWPIRFNPYAWGIERYDGGDWTHVAPAAYPEPIVELPAGSTMRWELPSETRPARTRPSPTDGDGHRLSVALDPGVYAFHLTVGYGGVSMETPTDAPKPTDRVELVALFRVEERLDPKSQGTSGRQTETGAS